MHVTFDTSIFIGRRKIVYPSLLSVVVIQEIMAGAIDSAEIRDWMATAKKYDKDGLLLVPTAEDWLQAGKILNSLLRGLKSKARGKERGKTPKLTHLQKQNLIRDVLIARTVKRVGAALVTDNLDDFRAISTYCSVRLISGKEYFF
jgi:predicted nucleic acid-binding protein